MFTSSISPDEEDESPALEQALTKIMDNGSTNKNFMTDCIYFFPIITQ